MFARIFFACIFVIMMSVASNTNATELRGGTEEDYAALQAIAQDWMKAYGSGDLEALMPLYDARTRMMPEGLGNFRGVDEIRAYFGDGMKAFDLEVAGQVEEIEVNSTWAYLIGIFAAKVIPKDGSDADVVGGRYFILLRKDSSGEWKVLRDMDNYTTDVEPLIISLRGES